MDTINWLHIRGLALLALLGLFVMYALLAAYFNDACLYKFFTFEDAEQSRI